MGYSGLTQTEPNSNPKKALHLRSSSPSPSTSAQKQQKGQPPPLASAQSNRPIFECERFVVFEWLLADLRKLLGKHVEEFRLDEWFYTLSARADADDLTLDKRTSGMWIYAQTVEEAERRGLRTTSSRIRPEDLVVPGPTS
jgi:hypothetical protein